MGSFMNQVFSIILTFMMLVLAPLLNVYTLDSYIGKMLILNDVSSFISQGTDTGEISSDDLDKLYLSCNSHGLAVNVTVKRLIRTEINKDGQIQTVYYAKDAVEDLKEMNTHDVVKVIVDEVGVSTARKFMYQVLKVDDDFSFSLAGAVG